MFQKRDLALVAIAVLLVIISGSIQAASGFGKFYQEDVETWISISAHLSSLPNIGLVPSMSLYLRDILGLKFAFAAMSQNESWLSLEGVFLRTEYPVNLWGHEALSYPWVGFYSQLVIRTEEEDESVSTFNFGLVGGLETTFQLDKFLLRFEAETGLGISLKLIPRFFIQIGMGVQFRSFSFSSL